MYTVVASALSDTVPGTFCPVVLSRTAIVLGVSVVPSRTPLVCTTRAAFTGTLVAFGAGAVLTTPGANTIAVGPVVKWVVTGGTGLPSPSVTPAIVSVSTVFGGSTPCGVTVTS